MQRYPGVVRVTHWLTFVSFAALMISGCLIVVSHPRFYWGEVGNVNTRPLFTIPIPSSRATVPTGYHYLMPDENGWSRYLHFEAAWALVLCGLSYVIYGLWSGHFLRNLVPERSDWSWRAYRDRLLKYIRRAPAGDGEGRSYNVLQRTTYLVVIFGLFPLMIWTGLAMSPTFTAVAPWTAALAGGRQSARTIHFICAFSFLGFFIVHIVMVVLSGTWNNLRSMITGRYAIEGKNNG